MPRSLWNGTISFGAVNVPVKLYSAVQSRTVHFHQVHLPDGARIEHRRFCSQEDREVPYDEVVKGYEVAPEEWVVLDRDEVKAAAGRRTKIIAVEHFVEAGDLDPVHVERTYFVGAQEDGVDAYRLFHDALARTKRAAIGRFVFHNREYLTAVRAFGGILALHTLRFADEVVAGEDLELDEPQREPAEREIAMAGQLVEGLHQPFRADDYEDEYRHQVLELIDTKAAGREVAPPTDEPADGETDLEAALEASLARSGS